MNDPPHDHRLIRRRSVGRRLGFSMIEVVLSVSLLALVVALASQRYYTTTQSTRRNTCRLQAAEIDLQVRRFHRAHGAWPRVDLRDINQRSTYFPNGVGVCPVDGTPYRLRSSDHTVIPHRHN